MLIYITNRKLCDSLGDYYDRIDLLCKGKPDAIILREKDLSLSEYTKVAERIKYICDTNNVQLIINQNITTAIAQDIPNIHLSIADLRKNTDIINQFNKVGASIHSVEEAKEAKRLGANYLIAGHIYPTECKKGVPPRGLIFLKQVCDSVEIPVYAIGGISTQRTNEVLGTGAQGICIMSEAMVCSDPIGLRLRYNP